MVTRLLNIKDKMKTKILVVLLLIASVTTYAQKDVTKFLGIPVDGTKTSMIQKLKAKGFEIAPYKKDVLTGEFNGAKVNLYIVTNNNKVCRIMVYFTNTTDESNIKISFNRLCRQFYDNEKYIPASGDINEYIIPDNEDVSFGITVHKKRYEAIFYQRPTQKDLMERAKTKFGSKYTQEQIYNPTQEIEEEITDYLSNILMEECPKRPVWFMINEYIGEYYITLFYDNEYNRANGEDL